MYGYNYYGVTYEYKEKNEDSILIHIAVFLVSAVTAYVVFLKDTENTNENELTSANALFFSVIIISLVIFIVSSKYSIDTNTSLVADTIFLVLAIAGFNMDFDSNTN